MKHSPKIAVIGGTGMVGRHVAAVALERGYAVRLLVRNPQKLASPGEAVEVIQGNAEDAANLRALLEDADAVINAYGRPPKEEPRYSAITARILEAMAHQGVRRYIGVAGASLDIAGDEKSLLNRGVALAFKQFFPAFVADRTKEVELLAASEVDWTLVRLPLVVEGTLENRVKESLSNTPGMTIRNRDIARFLVEQVESRDYLRKSPFIAN